MVIIWLWCYIFIISFEFPIVTFTFLFKGSSTCCFLSNYFCISLFYISQSVTFYLKRHKSGKIFGHKLNIFVLEYNQGILERHLKLSALSTHDLFLFGVFKLLIWLCDKGFSVLNIPWSHFTVFRIYLLLGNVWLSWSVCITIITDWGNIMVLKSEIE